MLLNRCGAAPPDNGFGSPHHTHSKSMSWDPHTDRLFLLLRFGQLLVGEHFYNNASKEFVSLLFLSMKISLYSVFGNNSDLFDMHV